MPTPGVKGTDCEKTFVKLVEGKPVSNTEAQDLTYRILQHLCRLYHKNGWVQQFHLGALRNTNQKRLAELGPDTGFDSIGDFSQARAMANFLNCLETDNTLAKTILYNLNPSDNEVMATMVGNFSEAGVKGKVQWGSAWWYLDQKDGMERHLNTLSNMGLLSCFVGMLTDSRSFLSFPRHEYFRRILCNLLGNDVDRGDGFRDDEGRVADGC
jgi:glucuronate isomerase